MRKPERCLITGGAGFIGHHVVGHLLKETDLEIIVLDRATWTKAGVYRLNAAVPPGEWKRVQAVPVDLASPVASIIDHDIGAVDYILHLAAESHVTRSIADPLQFVRANVMGTAHLLEWVRTLSDLKRFVYFSTDEVFGPATEGQCFGPWARHNPCNPYAATKSAGEMLAVAYSNTYGVPTTITHCMNVFGERQHPEKFLPMCVKRTINGEPITIHVDSDDKPCVRFWIHADDVASALLFLIRKTEHEHCFKWNIPGTREMSTLAIAERVAEVLGTQVRVDFVEPKDRPGNDTRYCVDGEALISAGWKEPTDFDQRLDSTIRWYYDNPHWLET